MYNELYLTSPAISACSYCTVITILCAYMLIRISAKFY